MQYIVRANSFEFEHIMALEKAVSFLTEPPGSFKKGLVTGTVFNFLFILTFILIWHLSLSDTDVYAPREFLWKWREVDITVSCSKFSLFMNKFCLSDKFALALVVGMSAQTCTVSISLFIIHSLKSRITPVTWLLTRIMIHFRFTNERDESLQIVYCRRDVHV